MQKTQTTWTNRMQHGILLEHKIRYADQYPTMFLSNLVKHLMSQCFLVLHFTSWAWRRESLPWALVGYLIMDFFEHRKCESRKPRPGLQTGQPHAAVLLTPLWLQMMCILFLLWEGQRLLQDKWRLQPEFYFWSNSLKSNHAYLCALCK